MRPKHVEWICRNKICIVLHQVGVTFNLTKTWLNISLLQSVKADWNECKGRRFGTKILTTPQSSGPAVKTYIVVRAKLQRDEFCTVGIKGQLRNIYNSERYVWRSDSVVGWKTTVVYGRALRNRDEENLILLIPCSTKPNSVLLNKKYNHILTKPAPAPYCTQIRFLAKSA